MAKIVIEAGHEDWNAMSIFPGWSAVAKVGVPRKFCL